MHGSPASGSPAVRQSGRPAVRRSDGLTDWRTGDPAAQRPCGPAAQRQEDDYYMRPIDRREFIVSTSGLAFGANMQNRLVRRSPGEGGSYELESVAAGRALKAPDGRVALTYLTSKPEGSNLRANSACCFHPVTTPSGERLTDLAPGDHVHHRGIFLAWHSIDFRRKADFSKMGPTRRSEEHTSELQS